MSSRKFAVFDIDGTFFRWQLYYEIVLRLADSNAFDREDSERIRHSYKQWQSRTASFRDFEVIAIDTLTRHLNGLDVIAFDRIVQEVLDDSSHKVYSYTRGLATDLKEQGYFLLAISGSMQEIAEPFSLKYGFDDCIGWIYERKNGRFTGQTARQTVGNKATILKEYVETHGLRYPDSIAIGDSKGDIDILKLVERPIAFNPSIELFETARTNGWEIVIERKNLAYRMTKGCDGTYLLAETTSY